MFITFFSKFVFHLQEARCNKPMNRDVIPSLYKPFDMFEHILNIIFSGMYKRTFWVFNSKGKFCEGFRCRCQPRKFIPDSNEFLSKKECQKACAVKG